MLQRAVSWMLTAAMLFALIPLRARAEEPMPDEEPLPAEETLIPEETVPPEETALPEETELPEFSPEPEETPAPEPGLSAFAVLEPLPALPFADVPSGAWYHDAVQTLYALNLVSGVSSTAFSPSSALTAGQCAALSVRIYAAYHGAEIDVTQREGERWFDPWMRAARELNMLPAVWEGNQILTRQQALYLLYRTLPVSELQPIRTIERIPDLALTDAQYPEILCLYNAGIISGMDETGTLDGSGEITRAQYITLLSRLIQPAQRSAEPIRLPSGMSAFAVSEVPRTLPFADVKPGAYYFEPVCLLYHTGLVYGTDETHFSPSGTVTLAQAVVFSVRVYERYHGIPAQSDVSDMDEYLRRGVEYGVLPADWTGLDESAARAEVAYLIAHALPASELKTLRRVETLPDVAAGDPFSSEIFLLYRAGILNGNDAQRTFRGDSRVLRAELAAMLARLIDPAQRIGPDLKWVESIIQNAVAGYDGIWSVYLSDINSGRSLSVNPRRMWSASEVKLYVAGAVLEALENGTLQNSQTIQSQLKAMISWSSNEAWKSLASKLGGGSYSVGMGMVNAWADRNGYPDSGRRETYGNWNTTSAVDCGHFLERVLAGTNVSAAASAQMLEYLKAQEVTYKIPAGVPAGVPTANKTGELDDVENDAAIIYAPFGTYVLVILTENGSIRNVRNLSSIVYTAMEQATG